MIVRDARPLIRFEYVNHRGELYTRTVTPMSLAYRKLLPWYPEPVWLMRAMDHDKGESRDFQITKMQNIREVT